MIYPDDLIHSGCRWCGSLPNRGGGLETRFEFTTPDRPGERYQLAVCPHCRVWQVEPHWSREAGLDFFRAPERWRAGLTPEGLETDPWALAQRRRPEYRGYAEYLKRRLPAGGQALDVGCGPGLMLALLRPQFAGVGLEINEAPARAARGQGLTVKLGPAEEADFPPRRFQAIIFNQSLDHLTFPGLFLAKALDWLAPGGYLLVSGLIDPLSLASRIYGPRHRLWHPAHQLYISPGALGAALADKGLAAEKIIRPYWRTPYGGPIKLLKAGLRMALKRLGFDDFRPSPPWPGNIYTLWARKRWNSRD